MDAADAANDGQCSWSLVSPNKGDTGRTVERGGQTGGMW